MKSVLDNFDGIELWHINLDGIYVFLCAIFALQDLIEELRYNHFNFSIGYEIVVQKPYQDCFDFDDSYITLVFFY